MRNIIKSLLCTLALVSMAVTACAQSYVTSDVTVTHPLSLWQLNGQSFKTDPATHKITVRVFAFANNITYEVELSGPDFAAINKENGVAGDKFYVDWSGSSDKVKVASLGNGQYVIADSRGTMDGVVAEKEGIWVAIINGKVSTCVTDIHTGTSLEQVKTALNGLGKYTSFKQTGTVGGLKEYTLYGMQLHDNYYGGTTARADDPYAKFYLNASNQVVKWYMK